MRTGTGALSEEGRPMTAVRGAGYVSAKSPHSRGGSGGMHRPKGPSVAEQCKQLEEQVHSLIEDAAALVQDGSYTSGACLARLFAADFESPRA